MSARGEGEQAITSGGYNAGGLVAYPLPDEIVVPLRREELDTLCEGGVSEERANRDLYIGAGEKLGVGVLRKAWLNVDLVWAAALMGTGAATLVM
ncbi:MAG: hypothetical protein DMG96_14740 [Acidobacteria bacterium]|nr:MAG: hypothetical protein DMG96_14740 [Acidobacteriota bacterium]